MKAATVVFVMLVALGLASSAYGRSVIPSDASASSDSSVAVSAGADKSLPPIPEDHVIVQPQVVLVQPQPEANLTPVGFSSPRRGGGGGSASASSSSSSSAVSGSQPGGSAVATSNSASSANVIGRGNASAGSSSSAVAVGK